MTFFNRMGSNLEPIKEVIEKAGNPDTESDGDSDSESVQKTNPHHGPDGRFASGSGGSSASADLHKLAEKHSSPSEVVGVGVSSAGTSKAQNAEKANDALSHEKAHSYHIDRAAEAWGRNDPSTAAYHRKAADNHAVAQLVHDNKNPHAEDYSAKARASSINARIYEERVAAREAEIMKATGKGPFPPVAGYSSDGKKLKK